MRKNVFDIYICFNNDGEGVRLIAALIIIMILIAAWFFAMGMPVWLGIIFAIVIVFSIPFFISKKENDEKKKKRKRQMLSKVPMNIKSA